MKIQFTSVHFDADQKLLAFVEKKVNKLLTFNSHIIDAHVFFRIDKDKEHGNKVVEIRLNIPSHQVFAKEKAASFEEGADHACEALRRQLKKIKEKEVAHH